MAGRQIQLAVMPARPLRFTSESEVVRRVAVDDRNEFTLRRQIGNPPGADGNEPEIACVIKGAPSRNLPCGASWMSANSETGPMPGGGGGRPQARAWSDPDEAPGGAEPVAGAAPVPAEGACADAAPSGIRAPRTASDKAWPALFHFLVIAFSPMHPSSAAPVCAALLCRERIRDRAGTPCHPRGTRLAAS